MGFVSINKGKAIPIAEAITNLLEQEAYLSTDLLEKFSNQFNISKGYISAVLLEGNRAGYWDRKECGSQYKYFIDNEKEDSEMTTGKLNMTTGKALLLVNALKEHFNNKGPAHLSTLLAEYSVKFYMSKSYISTILKHGADAGYWSRTQKSRQNITYFIEQPETEPEPTVEINGELHPVQLMAVDRILAQLDGMGLKYKISYKEHVWTNREDFSEFTANATMAIQACPVGQYVKLTIPEGMAEPNTFMTELCSAIFGSDNDFIIQTNLKTFSVYKGAPCLT